MAFGKYLGYIVGAVGAIVGGVIGFYSGGPVGAATGAIYGFSIGSLVGGVAGQVFWPERTELNLAPPPQPHETRLQLSSWGIPIPIQYGSGRMAGNIIYMSDIKETIERSKHRQDGVRYYEMVKTYTATFAIAFCEGPIAGVGRIWMNNKVFVDYRDPYGPYYPSGDISMSSANVDTTIAREAVFFSLHLGAEDQTVDPTIAALLTAAETPAHRGIFYIVFIDFPIGEFSGVPNIEVEVSENAITSANVNTGADDSEYRPNSGNFYSSIGVLRVGNDSSYTTIFVRFNLIRVRPSATITKATLTMHCANRGIAGRPISGTIYATKEDNATAPTSVATAFAKTSNWTTAHVHYTGTSDSINIGDYHSFSDISAIIQEIINRPGWVYGNSILIALESYGVGGNGYWDFGAFEDVSGYDQPTLEIEWAIN